MEEDKKKNWPSASAMKRPVYSKDSHESNPKQIFVFHLHISLKLVFKSWVSTVDSILSYTTQKRFKIISRNNRRVSVSDFYLR